MALLNSSNLIKSILFFGNDHFSVRSLQHILQSKNNYNIEAIASSYASPLHKYAITHDIPVSICPSNIRDLKFPEKGKFDIGVVISFGHFLPGELLDKFKLESLNVHPSLLPAYRGSSPIQRCIYNGDEFTGVSIISLDRKRFDRGKIFSCQYLKVPKYSDFNCLSDILANKSGEMIVNVLENYGGYLNVSYPQEKSIMKLPLGVQKYCMESKAPKIRRKDAQIGNINVLSAEKIYRAYLAFSYLYPIELEVGSTKIRGDIKNLELTRIEVEIINVKGMIYYSHTVNTLYIKCHIGWIAFTKLQLQHENGEWKDETLEKASKILDYSCLQ